MRRYRQYFIWEGPNSRAYEVVVRGLWAMALKDWDKREEWWEKAAQSGAGEGGDRGGEGAAAEPPPAVAAAGKPPAGAAAGGAPPGQQQAARLSSPSPTELGNDGDELGGWAREEPGQGAAAGGEGGAPKSLWEMRPLRRAAAARRRKSRSR